MGSWIHSAGITRDLKMRDWDSESKKEENDRGEVHRNSRLKSPLAALLVAFLPLALLTVVECMPSLVSTRGKIRALLLLLVSAISVICCRKGSVMLFARNTTFGSLGGIAFMILNGVVALFTGYAAWFIWRLSR